MSQCWLPRLSLPELLLLPPRGGLTNRNEDEENLSENISEDFRHANMSKLVIHWTSFKIARIQRGLRCLRVLINSRWIETLMSAAAMASFAIWFCCCQNLWNSLESDICSCAGVYRVLPKDMPEPCTSNEKLFSSNCVKLESQMIVQSMNSGRG